MGRRRKIDKPEPKQPEPEKKPERKKPAKAETPPKVEVQSGKLMVKRTSYGGTRVKEKSIEVTPFITAPATVHIKEATQIGEDWLTVGVYLPCYVEEIHEAKEFALNFVDEAIQAEAGEADAENDEIEKEEREVEDDEYGDDDDDETGGEDDEESGEEDEEYDDEEGGEEGDEDDDDFADED